MPGQKRCIFCDTLLQPSQRNLPSSRTKEHVFAEWYRGGVVNNKMKMFTASKGQSPALQRQPPLESLVNFNVCAKCNNGWMEKLETEVDAIIQRLREKDDFENRSKEEIETLARWTAKTAVVLSHVTPEKNNVPKQMAQSLHPDSRVRPQCAFFYGRIEADLTLEGGFLQLIYGEPLIGSSELAGTRITLCVYNHMLTVDFPPITEGIFYDLSQSISAKFWPSCQPAGKKKLDVTLPCSIGDVLLDICQSIQVGFREAAIR